MPEGEGAGTSRPSLPTWADLCALEAPVAEVAVTLLGALLICDEGTETEVVARIVETEAYGADDPASHSARGRTRANAAMFGLPGTAYVYRSYGLHWCANVVAEPAGTGAAVLVRAAAVLVGASIVRSRRPAARSDAELLRGPGRLTVGLALTGAHDGRELLTGSAGVRLAPGPRPETVVTTPRVGISRAADRPLRFHLGTSEVSAYRRHPAV